MSETTNEAESTFLGIYLEHAGLDDLLGPGATDLYYEGLLGGHAVGLTSFGHESPFGASNPLAALWHPIYEHAESVDALDIELNRPFPRMGEVLAGIEAGNVTFRDPTKAELEERKNLAAVYLLATVANPNSAVRLYQRERGGIELLLYRWDQAYGYLLASPHIGMRDSWRTSNPIGELDRQLWKYVRVSTFLDNAFDAIKDQELLDDMSIGDLTEYLELAEEMMERSGLEAPGGPEEERCSYTLGNVKEYRESTIGGILDLHEEQLDRMIETRFVSEG